MQGVQWRTPEGRRDAVNIASRIEPLAEPDGICITQQVADLARNKLPAPVVSLGKRRVKNVAEPLEIFCLDALGGADAPGATRSVLTRWRKPLLVGGGAAAAVLVAIIGWWAVTVLRSPSPVPAPGTTGVRSLAVLPFTGLSPARDNEYFCDGLTEELITALVQIEGLHEGGRSRVRVAVARLRTARRGSPLAQRRPMPGRVPLRSAVRGACRGRHPVAPACTSPR